MKKLLSLVAAAALLFVTCVPEAKVDKGDEPEDKPVASAPRKAHASGRQAARKK